jgi:uncharacterized membrane protein YbjE (DUF340 family)
MYTVLFFILTGIGTGYLFRKRKISFVNQLITMLIWLLLFILGVEVGVNENVVKKFHLLGYEAFLIAFFATLGSVIGAWILLPLKSEKSNKKGK